MRILLISIFFLLTLTALTFIARLLCAFISPQIASTMRRHPICHVIWGAFAIIGIVAVFGPFHPGNWPPDWVERKQQRRLLTERVATAGGWEALKQACTLLVEQHPNDPFYWHRFIGTNALPAAIAALEPLSVQFFPPGILPHESLNPPVPVVQIKIFGMPSTGGNASPYLGLSVVCSTNTDAYEPRRGESKGVPGNRHTTFRKVADNVFEVY
jgi:hypothetical protein